MWLGASNPKPVSSTVSERKLCRLTRFCLPPSAKYVWAVVTTPAGTVDRSVSSASTANSPDTTTRGFLLASSASSPHSQARLPPNRRTTNTSVVSTSWARVCSVSRFGLAYW